MRVRTADKYSVTVVTSVPWDMGTSTASSIDACMGKTIFFLFNWSLFQSRNYNCTSIGSCRIKKTNQCTAVASEPIAMQPPLPTKIGGASVYIISCSATASQIVTEYVPFRYFTRTAWSINACLGTSPITPCYDVERLVTKTHVRLCPG